MQASHLVYLSVQKEGSELKSLIEQMLGLLNITHMTCLREIISSLKQPDI